MVIFPVNRGYEPMHQFLEVKTMLIPPVNRGYEPMHQFLEVKTMLISPVNRRYEPMVVLVSDGSGTTRTPVKNK